MKLLIKNRKDSNFKYAAHIVAVPGINHMDESFIRLDEQFMASHRPESANVTIPNGRLNSCMSLLMLEIQQNAEARLRIERQHGLSSAQTDKRWIELMQQTHSCALFMSVVTHALVKGEDISFGFLSGQ